MGVVVGGLLPGNHLPPPGEMVSSYCRPIVRGAPTSDGTVTALPFPEGSRLPASPFQTRSGDPPSAPQASGEVGTLALALAPESDIPEATRPPTPCQPQILGRARLGGGAGCGQGKLWEGPESEHLSTGGERSQARDRADTPPRDRADPATETRQTPAPRHFPGTVHLWPAYHPEGRISDAAFLKRHILFTWQSPLPTFYKRISRQSCHSLCDLGQTRALSGPQRLMRGLKWENLEGALQQTVFIIPRCCDFSLSLGSLWVPLHRAANRSSKI